MILADERIIIKHLKNVIRRHTESKCTGKLIKAVNGLEKDKNKQWRMYL